MTARAAQSLRGRALRAFTLTEAALSLALVGVIAVAAVGLYAAVTRTFSNTRKAAMLTDRAQSALDYMLQDLRSIGGNGLPAWAAIYVEDAADARGASVTGFPDGSDAAAAIEGRPPIPGRADRLTTFTAIKNVPTCPISAITGPTGAGQGTASFEMPPIPPATAPICCFTMGGVRPFVRTVVLAANDVYRPVLLTNTSGTCTFNWQDIVLDEMREPLPTAINDFVGGNAVLVDFRTYYVDTQTHDLNMHLDTPPTPTSIMNGFGATPTVVGERFRVLDGVYDFQVSLGFDLDNSGDLTDSGGSDEWLHNAPGETATSEGVAATDRNRLRMVRIEMVVGIPSPGRASSASARSPARAAATFAVPGVSLRAVGGRFAPRNVDLVGGS